MSDNLRMSHGDRAAGGEVNIAKDAHILIRRQRVPIHKRDRKVVGSWCENLKSQSVDFTGTRPWRDVKFKLPAHAHHLIGAGNFAAVEPDIRTVIDAVEMLCDTTSPAERGYPKALECWRNSRR